MNTNPSGAGSLAAEVAAANVNTDEAIVNFDPTAFATHQTITLTQTLTLDHASEPKIPISIVGPAAGVTIAGGGASSDFPVITVTSDTQQAAIKGDSPSAPITITLGDLTGPTESGAGIDDFGDLVLQNVAITGNSSAGAGGGVEVSGGPNILTSNPGAALLASDTTFSGNTAATAGGAVDMEGSAALIVNSTFSGNTAGTTGGAINNGPMQPFVSLVTPANLGLINDTIAANSAVNDGGGIDNNHGGIMGILSSIIAGNTVGGTGTNPDVDSGGSAGVLAQSSHVLIGNANGLSGSGISDGSNGDIVGHPAGLAPLGDYGGVNDTGTLVTGSGVNQTFALLPGSPALTDPAFVLASLASPAAATDTTLQVQTPVPYLSLNGSTNPYGQGKIIEIGGEQMLVTGVTGSSSSGFTLTVTRGVNGTTATAHSTNDPLYLPDGRGVFPPSGSIQNIGAFESQGFNVTADAGDTPQSATVSTAFANPAHSDEYYQNFVIRPAYSNLLGRAADAGGVTFWTTQMDTGVTDQELEADLVSSPEFFADAGGTNTLWIDAVYKLLLGRAPDANGEMFWNSQLAAGQTLNQVAQGIAGSTENNALLINDDYFHYLGRVADSGGLAFWLSQFAAGQTNEDVIAGFTGSPEYFNGHTS